MVFINEWLPNPEGSDAAGEWIELRNNGENSVDLSGFKLQTKGGSKTMLSGEVGSNGYIVFRRQKSKLVLKNSGEELFLYNREGELVDQSSFFGSAPEGQSFSRSSGGSFFWADPTPEAANKISLTASLAKTDYPLGANISRAIAGQEIILLALGVGIVFAAIAVFVVKKDANLSQLFFGRN